jgi:hypothetical protein
VPAGGGKHLDMTAPGRFAAGGYVEELSNRRELTDDERRMLRERYRWEVVAPNPL